MSDEARDLPATIVGLCKDLCDIAHALSRATCMPDPADDKTRDVIKEGIISTAQGIKETAASVLTLGVVAGFDTTEIHPDGMSDTEFQSVKRYADDAVHQPLLRDDPEYQEQEEDEPFETDPEPDEQEVIKKEYRDRKTPKYSPINKDQTQATPEPDEQEEEVEPEEPKSMGVQELLAKLKDRRGKDDEEQGGS